MSRLVIIDADTLLFSAAAVTEKRFVDVLHKPTGIVKTFDTRTQFKELMKSKAKDITEDYVITDRQEPEDIANCLHLVKSSANNIVSRFQFDDIVFVAGDENNFRLDLPLPTRYKDFRKDMIRPVHLKEAHSYFRNKYKAEKAKGMEADDLVTVLANEAVAKGRQAVILSKDKDKRQSIGIYVGDYEADDSMITLVQHMHEIELKESKFKSLGVPWIVYQTLVGDASDGYKPSKLANVKYGDAGAYKDLKACKNPQELLQVLKEKYQAWYPEPFEYTAWDGVVHKADWKSMLQLYYSCARMKRTYDDDLAIDKFFNEYGVEL